MIGSDLEGATWKAGWRAGPRAPLEDHAVQVPAVAGAVEGAAPASSESATRIRARSASACGRRARRGAGGHVDLPARTGAVQVDVGVAGAVRVPALGAAGAATPAWSGSASPWPAAWLRLAPPGHHAHQPRRLGCCTRPPGCGSDHHLEGAWPLSSCPAGPGRPAEGSHPAGRSTPPGGW